MKHYIIIEVRERDTRTWGTDAGDIRKALHSFCDVSGINAADTLIRADRAFIYGTNDRVPYIEAQNLFNKAMGSFWRKMKETEIPWDSQHERAINDYTAES